MTATILVIDDSADDQRLCQRAFKDSGYSLEMASTAEAGLARVADANSKRPNLILLDYNLPDMDGLGFMKKLTEYSDIPIVMLTGENNATLAVEAMKHGADDYLVKDTGGRYLKLLPGVVGRVTAAHAQREQIRRVQQENEELLHKLSAQQIELEMQNDALRRAQLTMEESRDRYVDLYDFAPIGYLTLTREALISEINLTGAALLGEERDKLIHSRFARLVAPEDSDRWHLHFMDTLQHNGQRSFELALRRGDGSRFHAQLDCLRLINDGDVTVVRLALTDITGRKQADAVLRRHDVVISTVIDGFWIADTMGNLLEVNEAYAKISGYSVDELVEMHVSQLEAKEQSPEEVEAHITKIIAQGYDRFETRHRHKDGHEIDIEVSVTYLAESQQLFAFCHDITRRKQMEEALRVAAAAFETQDAIMVTDADRNIVRVNRAFSDITGYSPEEVLGKSPGIMNPEQSGHDPCIEMLQQSIRDGSWAGEIWGKRKDGRVYPMWMTSTAIRNDRQEIIRYVTMFSDITARKQIEKENLRESDERFRGTLEQAAVGITHTALDGYFKQANQTFCNLVGYTRDELLQMSFYEITFPGDLEKQERLFQQLLAGEIPTFSMEKRYVRKDRSLVLAILTVSLLRDADGAPKYTIGVVEDIAERKHAELLAQQFGHLLQNSFNEIYLLDAHNLHFLLASDGAERNLGYSFDELNQLTLFDLIPLLSREGFEQMVAPLRGGVQPSLTFETVLLRKGGATYPVDMRLQLMEADRPIFMAIAQDITERQRADRELGQSRNLLRELVAQSEAFREEERKCLAREVHDELGQILTALRMNVSLLRIEFGAHDNALLKKIERITELLDQSIQCVRDVVNNLRPVALDMGIVPAIRWLCDEFIKHTGTSCVVDAPEEEIHLDEALAVAAFRVVPGQSHQISPKPSNASRYESEDAARIRLVGMPTFRFDVSVRNRLSTIRRMMARLAPAFFIRARIWSSFKATSRHQ